MTYLLAFISALVISIAVIPAMIRLAPRLGMVDLPDPRRAHAKLVPRVGGLGIVFGALISLLLWLPLDAAMLASIRRTGVVRLRGLR